MAKIESKGQLTLTLRLVLNENEARALQALGGYGEKDVIQALASQISTSFGTEYREGLTVFLSSLRSELSPHLNRADDARKVFNEGL